MEKTKTQKGITLIALIITIVVLVILAAVAIGAIKNDGLISRAQTGKNVWDEAQKNESTILGEYESEIAGGRAGYKWVQNGETVTKVNKEGKIIETLVVGNFVNGFVATGLEANENLGVELWRVLGEENGELLLVSVTPKFVDSGYVGSSSSIFSKYANSKYATSARALTVEDLKFNKEYSLTGIADYKISDTNLGDKILNCSGTTEGAWWTNHYIHLGVIDGTADVVISYKVGDTNFIKTGAWANNYWKFVVVSIEAGAPITDAGAIS